MLCHFSSILVNFGQFERFPWAPGGLSERSPTPKRSSHELALEFVYGVDFWWETISAPSRVSLWGSRCPKGSPRVAQQKSEAAEREPRPRKKIRGLAESDAIKSEAAEGEPRPGAFLREPKTFPHRAFSFPLLSRSLSPILFSIAYCSMKTYFINYCVLFRYGARPPPPP